MFEHNHCSNLLPTDYGYIDNIISKVNGHTLVLELIAKQISSSYLSICEASNLVDTHGFAEMAPEKVIYSKDADAYPDTLRNIITALFEADNLSEQMRNLLKVMFWSTATALYTVTSRCFVYRLRGRRKHFDS